MAQADEQSWPADRRSRTLHNYLNLLNRPDWVTVARDAHMSHDPAMTWLGKTIGPRLGLSAFDHPPDG
ncbi:hypothetical protein [Nocardia bhagyanarayanae]|uniref:hypothetical protein n=1 Tax=Nocardia bhagyanarayanae TaxID=1215925 RepID=UPI00114DD50E|nr:hypothetical protein [Nocardia bhagyanarayanae]